MIDGFTGPGVPLSHVPRFARICALGWRSTSFSGRSAERSGPWRGRRVLPLCRGDGRCGDAFRRRRLRRGAEDPDPYPSVIPLDRLLDRMRGEGTIRADDVALAPAADP
jgi:hypothetical protein